MGIEAPIMTGVYQMLHEGKPPLAAVQDLHDAPAEGGADECMSRSRSRSGP